MKKLIEHFNKSHWICIYCWQNVLRVNKVFFSRDRIFWYFIRFNVFVCVNVDNLEPFKEIDVQFFFKMEWEIYDSILLNLFNCSYLLWDKTRDDIERKKITKSLLIRNVYLTIFHGWKRGELCTINSIVMRWRKQGQKKRRSSNSISTWYCFIDWKVITKW